MIQPFISVVIPTYNRQASLLVTLEGLSRQTYAPDDFEVIVVSDGSTDGTDETVTAFARIAPYRMRLFTQQNAGPSRARNRGVQEAIGEVIVFLDDDVEPVSEWLSSHAAHHRADGRVAVIGPMRRDPQRQSAEPCWIAWEHAMLEKQYTNWDTGVWNWVGPHNFYSGNASVRRAHVLAIGGFDERFKRQEDVELASRMEREASVSFCYDGQACGIHRPTRSFASWLNIPYAYGQLDVVRVRNGNMSWRPLRDNYQSRNRVTRILSSVVVACPVIARPLRGTLLLLARGSYSTHIPKLARLSLAALSVIYNLRYLEGIQTEIGANKDIYRLFKQNVLTKEPVKS